MSIDMAQSSSLPLDLVNLIASFRGQSYLALLALLKNPGIHTSDMAAAAGVHPDSIYRWRIELSGFKDAMDAIRRAEGDLRKDYAQAAMREAVPALVDKMIEVGKGEGRDSQRARERVLETTGVLPKPGIEPGTPQVQVNTFTYYLVQPGQEPKPFLIETTKAIAASGTKDATNTPS